MAVENIRVEKRPTRDLLQDIRDTREGFTVIHKNDIDKRIKESKRAHRRHLLDTGERRERNRTIRALVAILEESEDHAEVAEARSKLAEFGVDVDLLTRKEQMTLF